MGRNKTQGRGPSQEAGRRKGAPLRQEGGTSRLDGVKDAAVQKCRAWHSDSHESPPPIHHETICRPGGQMPHIRRTCLAFHSWKLDFSHGRTRRICKICGRWDFQIRPCPAQFGRDFMVCRVRRILHRIYSNKLLCGSACRCGGAFCRRLGACAVTDFVDALHGTSACNAALHGCLKGVGLARQCPILLFHAVEFLLHPDQASWAFLRLQSPFFCLPLPILLFPPPQMIFVAWLAIRIAIQVRPAPAVCAPAVAVCTPAGVISNAAPAPAKASWMPACVVLANLRSCRRGAVETHEARMLLAMPVMKASPVPNYRGVAIRAFVPLA